MFETNNEAIGLGLNILHPQGGIALPYTSQQATTGYC